MPRREITIKILYDADPEETLEESVGFSADWAAKFWPDANVNTIGRDIPGEVRWLPLMANDGWSKRV